MPWWVIPFIRGRASIASPIFLHLPFLSLYRHRLLLCARSNSRHQSSASDIVTYISFLASKNQVTRGLYSIFVPQDPAASELSYSSSAPTKIPSSVAMKVCALFSLCQISRYQNISIFRQSHSVTRPSSSLRSLSLLFAGGTFPKLNFPPPLLTVITGAWITPNPTRPLSSTNLICCFSLRPTSAC